MRRQGIRWSGRRHRSFHSSLETRLWVRIRRRICRVGKLAAGVHRSIFSRSLRWRARHWLRCKEARTEVLPLFGTHPDNCRCLCSVVLAGQIAVILWRKASDRHSTWSIPHDCTHVRTTPLSLHLIRVLMARLTHDPGTVEKLLRQLCEALWLLLSTSQSSSASYLATV